VANAAIVEKEDPKENKEESEKLGQKVQLGFADFKAPEGS
jgi:hypothetical protein